MEVRREVLSRDSPPAAQSAQAKCSGPYHCSSAGSLPTQKRFPATFWGLASEWPLWDSGPALLDGGGARTAGPAFGARDTAVWVPGPREVPGR